MMNDFKVYKTIHFPDEWAAQNTAMFHKEYNTTKGSYMYHYVCQMNRDPKHHFYILGILNDKVIASCFVSTYIDYLGDECIENFDEYIISGLIVDKDYQKQGYGTSFLRSVITILKEENAIKICAFACDKSKKLFENLGFVKNEDIKTFGMTVPGDDDSVYYELNIDSNFYLSTLNKDDVWIVSMSMNREYDEFYKHQENEPFILLPNTNTYANMINGFASKENALVKTVRCNKMAVGYAHIYYSDYDDVDPKYSEHSVSLEFYLDENYLFKGAIAKMVEETIDFYKEKIVNHNLKHIKVCLNKYTILMRRYDFYKRCLLELGFEQIDEEIFILKVA